DSRGGGPRRRAEAACARRRCRIHPQGTSLSSPRSEEGKLREANRVDRMKKKESSAQVAIVVRACQDKKATNISILQLDAQASGFTDFFVLCSGTNPRQVQAIADDVEQKLSAVGVRPKHTEGYTQADWVLMDYVDFVVHVFSESARKFYDLERLWKSAKRLQPADLEKPARKPAVKKAASKRLAGPKEAVKSPSKSAPRKRSSAKPRARVPEL